MAEAAGGHRGEWSLLLAPGAGAGRDQPGLVAIDHSAAAAGFVVKRMDFPYRLAGRRAPDRPDVLVSAVMDEAAALAAAGGLRPERMFVGGRSMGGRVCSMAVASGMTAAGLVLVSYPLHPPGRPERLRTEHFFRLALPCLFVSGTRDAFATPGELEQYVSAVPGPVTLHLVEGADHGLRRHEEEVAAVVTRWLVAQAGALR